MNNIYKINNNQVEVYNLIPKEREIAQFTTSELLKFNEDERVLIEEPTKGWFTTRKGVIFECGSFILRKSKNKELAFNNELLKRFIENKLRAERLVARDNLYYLVPDFYQAPNHNIRLTKDLFLELLLKQKDYSNPHLQEEDLSSIKDLFTIDQLLATISLDELTKIYKFLNDDTNVLEEQMTYLEDSTKVFKKLQ